MTFFQKFDIFLLNNLLYCAKVAEFLCPSRETRKFGGLFKPTVKEVNILTPPIPERQIGRHPKHQTPTNHSPFRTLCYLGTGSCILCTYYPYQLRKIFHCWIWMKWKETIRINKESHKNFCFHSQASVKKRMAFLTQNLAASNGRVYQCNLIEVKRIEIIWEI
jgi:hypothetical protein